MFAKSGIWVKGHLCYPLAPSHQMAPLTFPGCHATANGWPTSTAPGCSGSFVLGGLNKDSSTFLTLGGSTKCKQEDKPHYSACHFRGRVVLRPYKDYMKNYKDYKDYISQVWEYCSALFVIRIVEFSLCIIPGCSCELVHVISCSVK